MIQWALRRECRSVLGPGRAVAPLSMFGSACIMQLGHHRRVVLEWFQTLELVPPSGSLATLGGGGSTLGDGTGGGNGLDPST